MGRFVALSVAREFLWNVVRGGPRRRLVLATFKALPRHRHLRAVSPRILASLLVPPGILSRLVLGEAPKSSAGNRRATKTWRGHWLD